MASVNPTFFDIWRVEDVRSRLSRHLDEECLCSLRLTSSEICFLTTPMLFTRIRLTFTSSALSKQSRLEALSRIGHHVQHLTFSMPHTPDTFLPPLINPINGREVLFLYTPHTSIASTRPQYGTDELGDILTQQYPPIFHAATDVPSFIRTLRCMPNLRHLTVACPGQEPTQRYRRCVVDYALISLRIAIERASLMHLEKLTIYLHSSGLLYFRHMPGFGSTPAAGRRWRQIKKLKLTVDSWDFETNPLDHLKLIDDYIRCFSSNLEKICFTWNGFQGPCPLTLSDDPLFAPPRKNAKLFAEVTSPMSPLPAAPPRPAIKFPKLRYMRIRNAAMSSKQVEDLVCEHRDTVREFDFEDVTMTTGSWKEAFDPLSTQQTGSECWQSQYSGSDGDSFRTCQSNSDLRGDDEQSPTATPPLQTMGLRKHRLRRRHRRPAEAITDVTPAQKSRFRLPILTKPIISNPIPASALSATISAPILDALQPTVFSPDPTLQGVQHDWKQEAARRELAEDADKRVLVLRKARETVLAKLSQQFQKKRGDSNETKSIESLTCRAAFGGRRMPPPNESKAQLVPLMIFR